MAYLSELRIQPATIVRKVRRLPLPGIISVKPGDEVTALQEIARTELLPGEPAIVSVAKQLNVPPEEIGNYLKVAIGDAVKHKQVIASRTETSGVFTTELTALSPCDGVVEHISTAYGQVLIREAGDPVHSEMKIDLTQGLGVTSMLRSIDYRVRPGDEVHLGQILARIDGAGFVTAPATGTITAVEPARHIIRLQRAYQPALLQAYIPGRVVAVTPSESVTIETPAAFIQGVFGIGGERHGELALLTDDPAHVLTAAELTPAVAGKVIVGGAFADFDALLRAAELGAVGVIVGGARATDLSRLAGRNIGVGVTGHEEITLSVILTEGFGPLRMSARTFDLLKAHAGRPCSLSGASQIRAGVIRPEVIIPLAALTPAAEADGHNGTPSLAVGTVVRIIRAPYFGAWGRVAELASDAVARPTGARMPVLKVDLEDGRRVEVLENNVELMPAAK
ncbi:MAG: hypothetical protein ACM3XN_09370 [Chloroflexota bacterium]